MIFNDRGQKGRNCTFRVLIDYFVLLVGEWIIEIPWILAALNFNLHFLEVELFEDYFEITVLVTGRLTRKIYRVYMENGTRMELDGIGILVEFLIYLFTFCLLFCSRFDENIDRVYKNSYGITNF